VNVPIITVYSSAYFEQLTNLWLSFSKESSEKHHKVEETWTVSRTERNVPFPLKLSTIDLDGGLCDGFMSSDGVARDGLSSDCKEFECMPCMVGVLVSQLSNILGLKPRSDWVIKAA